MNGKFNINLEQIRKDLFQQGIEDRELLEEMQNERRTLRAEASDMVCGYCGCDPCSIDDPNSPENILLDKILKQP